MINARSDALKVFAIQAAIGLGFLYFSIIFTLGAALPHLRAPRYRESAKYRAPWVVRAATGVGFLASRHPAATLLCCAVLMAASIWGAFRLPINSMSFETYDADHPSMRAIRLVEERMGGILPLEIRLKADADGLFYTPEVYRKVGEFGAFARSRGPVLFARSYVDLHQEIGSEVTGEQNLKSTLPPPGEEGQRQIDRTTRFIRRVADQLHYGTFVSADEKQVRVLLKVRDAGTRELLPLFSELEGKLAELFPSGSGIDYLLTGDAYLNARAMDIMIRDLVRSLVGASVVIFAIMAVVFRSVRLGIIASIPNMTPLVLTLGYMALRGYELNVGNVMVFTISLGVAVDNTIHFVFRVGEELKHERTIVEAVERAIDESGRAMVTTSFLIVLGLVVLLLSDFVPTRRFAELTSVTMIGALVGDLMILPACLVLFWKGRSAIRTARGHDSPEAVLSAGGEPRGRA
jgi:predicted RND superfamily exporter protein